MSDEKTIELNDKTFHVAPLNEGKLLEMDRLGRRQEKTRLRRERLERQMREAEEKGKFDEADELFDEATVLSQEMISLGFELAQGSLLDEDGDPPAREDITDLDKVTDFLGWSKQADGAEPAEDPTPTSAPAA